MPRLGTLLPLVGRHAELAQLRAAVARADGGTPGGVLLSGEAGVGKTRLITALAEEAAKDGALVLTGRCLDIAEHELPYLAFADALAPLVGHDDSAVAEAVRGRHALGRLLPQLARPELPSTERSLVPAEQVIPGRSAPERNLGQLQLFDAVLGLLAELAGTRVVVLAIEDLHWADASTRDLLSFLLARVSSERLLILATYRSDDVHRSHPIRPLLARLARMATVERLELERFSEADSRAFIDALSDDPLPAAAVADIIGRAEGNAFFTEELLASGIAGAEIPGGLAEVLLSRLERLGPETQRVLRIASAADGGVTHPALSEVTGLPDAALDDAVREAVQHHVLVVDGKFHRFRHALLREAVYADLLPGERVRIHASYAKRLIGKDGARQAALLAYHSVESNDLPTALEASVRAADEAEGRGAPEAALRNVERALRIWDAVPDEERPAGVDELRLLQEAAYYAGTSGDRERAVAYARSAVELLDSPRGEQVGRERAAAVWRRLSLALNTATTTEWEAIEAIERAWQLLADAEPSKTRAWVLATRASLLRGVNRFDEAAVSAQAAAENAREAGTLGAEADALCTIAVLAEGKGEVEQARERLREAQRKARTAGAPTTELRAKFSLAISYNDAAEYESAMRHYRQGAERAKELGLQWSGTGRELRAHILGLRYLLGDWPEDDPTAGDPSAPGLAVDRMAAAYLPVLVGRGQFERAQLVVEELSTRWQSEFAVALATGMARGELGYWRGEYRVAMEAVVEAIEWLDHFEPLLVAGIRVAAIGVGAAVQAAAQARRRSDEAAAAEAVATGERLLRHAHDCAEGGYTRGPSLGPEGNAWLARVEAEAAHLHGGADPALWRHAVEAFGYGAVYEQAICRLRYAEALLAAQQDAEQVTVELREVIEVADRLGATPLRDAARGLAKRARVSVPGSPAGRATDPLTARERAVLELVADGDTNRQVGERLFISEKTVSVHLSRVMAKLGASRRAEAVAIAYDRGLL